MSGHMEGDAMGQCGCADFEGEFTLPAPDGGLYVFWRYLPCRDCGTPGGVVVCRLGRRDIEMWDAAKLPTLELEPERLISVIGVDALARQFRGVKPSGLSDYETLEDYFLDEGREAVAAAITETAAAAELERGALDDANRIAELAAEVARLRGGIGDEVRRLEHACTIHDRDCARARLLALLEKERP